ncbi:hypothetical protein NMY22_g15824 [Coprinellus aureogranulatus]|nr:hypothetical protein NMY22_g15824 [Coprinellus aureogranulatus]
MTSIITMDGRSPFSPYLRTNEALSRRELGVLKSLIKEHQSTTIALAQKIEEAKVALARLKEQQAAHNAFIEEYSVLFSPIRGVPTDVLALIFLATVDVMGELVDESFITPLQISTQHPSIVLSQVCSGWRRIALGTPQLWSNIQVAMPSFFIFYMNPDPSVGYSVWYEEVKLLQRKLKRFVERSSPCHIKLSLDTACCYRTENMVRPQHQALVARDYEVFVDRLCESSNRWREFHFRFGSVNSITKSMVKLFDRPHWNFPVLERISAHIWNDSRPHTETPMAVQTLAESGLFATPSLREVSLKGWWRDIPTAKARSTSPIYHSITRLSLSTQGIFGDPFDAWRSIVLLRSLPNLETVDFQLEDAPAVPLELVTPHSAFPNLTSMTLRGTPPWKGFGAALDLPNLTSLHLNGVRLSPSGQVGIDHDGGYAEIILKFGSQIKELTLCHESFPRSVLSRCLEQLSNLVTLHLNSHKVSYPISDECDIFVLHELRIPGICPKLAALKLSGIANCVRDGNSERAFVGLLVARLLERQSGDEQPQLSGATKRPKSPELVKAHVEFIGNRKTMDIVGELTERGVNLDDVELTIKYLRT